jgi:hypothetical protein
VGVGFRWTPAASGSGVDVVGVLGVPEGNGGMDDARHGKAACLIFESQGGPLRRLRADGALWETASFGRDLR